MMILDKTKSKSLLTILGKVINREHFLYSFISKGLGLMTLETGMCTIPIQKLRLIHKIHQSSNLK